LWCGLAARITLLSNHGMKDVRPSTWVLLGVLVLIIFGPLFLLDIDPIQELEPSNNAPDVRPADPRAHRDTPANRPVQNDPPANTPANNEPPKGRMPDDNTPRD
jgi:hypothetical protein